MTKEIKTSTGLIIVFAAAVILGGGALTYYNLYSPSPEDFVEQTGIVVKKKHVAPKPTTPTTIEEGTVE